MLGGLVVALLLYIFVRDTKHDRPAATWNAQTIDYDHDSRLMPAASVPEAVADKFHLHDLPVRVPNHPNPKPPLARESVFTDPWPSDSKIASSWLSETRLANIPMGFPNWPAEQELDSHKKQKLSKIPWKSLFRPEGYKGPVRLQELPSGAADEPPKIQQASFTEVEQDIAIRRARQDWVRRAFLHAWRGYKNKAWGHDEVKPVSGKGSNGFNGWGATIVDSLSTLLLMNMTEEYSLARTHVRQIDFSLILGEKSVYGSLKDSRTVPIFETIIRYLGGLLSAYDLSGGDQLMLERAEDLAGWLMGAFE